MVPEGPKFIKFCSKLNSSLNEVQNGISLNPITESRLNATIAEKPGFVKVELNVVKDDDFELLASS